MKFLSYHKVILSTILFLFLLSSCSNELETETYENSSLVTVKVQGTQSLFSKANIEIVDVQFRVEEDETDPNAWVSLNPVNVGIHDFTKITDDEVVTLVDFKEVPSKYIYSIRLILGDENTVEKNGVVYELHMASAYENASTNILEKQLIENNLYEFVIELDLDKSIEISSEGQADLNPKMNTMMRLFSLF